MKQTMAVFNPFSRAQQKLLFGTLSFAKPLKVPLLILAVSICAAMTTFGQSLTADGNTPTDVVCVGSTVSITVATTCFSESSAPSVSVSGPGGSVDVTMTFDFNSWTWNGSYTASTAGTFTISASDDCPDTFTSITLTVVQLNGISVGGATDIDGYNYATLKTTSSSDYVTVTADLTPDNSTAATVLEWTGGTPSSDNLSDKVHKNVSAETLVTASLACMDVHFLADVWVISAVLKSVEFTSDHHVMTDNNSDWTDSGTLYSKPDWVAGGVNNPISETKNTTVTLTATVNVQPAGLPFDMTGSSGSGFLNFGTIAGNTASGSDQGIGFDDPDANLPNSVGIQSSGISWSIDAFGGAFNCATASSSHKIYVTYNTPTGTAGASPNSITEKRMSQACTWANGKSSAGDIVNALGPVITGSSLFNASYSIYPGVLYQYSTAWELLGYTAGGNSYAGGDCISEATLMHYALDMLGVAGSSAIRVYPCHIDWYALKDNGPETDSTYGNLIYYQGSINNGNRYEGCCDYNGQYWPGYYGTAYSSAAAVLEFVSGPNNANSTTLFHQAWDGANWTWSHYVSWPTATPPPD